MTMYYFHFNFPTITPEKRFIIHCTTCNHYRDRLSGRNTFWTRDFKKYDEAYSALKRLITHFRNDDNYTIELCKDCGTIKSKAPKTKNKLKK